MNELSGWAGLAMHHLWAEREHARLQAEIVEAGIIARGKAADRAAERRARVLDRLGGLRPVRRREPAPYCARAAARSAHAVRLTGGAR
ncbi:hypothetical protein ACN3XK_43995 [Actinomadura welshii]